MPWDKVTGRHTGMGFVVFRHRESVEFAMRLMSRIRLYGRELVLTKMGSNVVTHQIQPVPYTPREQDRNYHPKSHGIDHFLNLFLL